MLTEPTWPQLPLSLAELENHRLSRRRRLRSRLAGGHLTRRRGQSLEFQEHTPYVLGDDVRHVDWRASARRGLTDSRHWLVRRFWSEEQITLALSLDLRPTMTGPALAPKRHVALWLGEALAWTRLHDGDRVWLHGLFGTRPAELLAGQHDCRRVRPALTRLAADSPTELRPAGAPESSLNLATIEPCLPAAAFWVMVTDGYMAEADVRALAASTQRARRGGRQVLLVELDSWPYERCLTGTGPRRIEGPGAEPVQQFEIDEPGLDAVEAAIGEHAALLRGRSGYARWSWPDAGPIVLGDFFRRNLYGERALAQLWMDQP